MLCYRIEGSGVPLLLIHGWGVTYPVWQNLAPLLTPHFQLIMIELPGAGSSPGLNPLQPYYPACAEAIEQLRQELGIEQWAILAYSTGTRVGEAYVQQYPQHVTRAAFLCPIYLKEYCWLGLQLEWWLETARPGLATWILSDWRLYGLVLALGFNWRRHPYTATWINEIELQSMQYLKRMLYELPGRGRMPFQTFLAPTLFVWGSRDALTSRPRRLRPNDVLIPANHSAPMLAASSVTEAVIPFLLEGKVLAQKIRRMRRTQRTDASLSRTRVGTRRHFLKLKRTFSRRRFAKRKQDTSSNTLSNNP